MRTVRGHVLLPPDAPDEVARLVVVEARDVSLMDVPSVVVAEQRLQDVAIGPRECVRVELRVPDHEPGRTIALRAHVSRDGTGVVARGDLLSVTMIELPPVDELGPIEIPVVTI